MKYTELKINYDKMKRLLTILFILPALMMVGAQNNNFINETIIQNNVQVININYNVNQNYQSGYLNPIPVSPYPGDELFYSMNGNQSHDTPILLYDVPNVNIDPNLGNNLFSLDNNANFVPARTELEQPIINFFNYDN